MGQAPVEGAGNTRDDRDNSSYDDHHDSGRGAPQRNRAATSPVGPYGERSSTTRDRGNMKGSKKNKKKGNRDEEVGPQMVQLDLSNKAITSEEMRVHFMASPVGRKVTSAPNVEQPKTHNRRHSRSVSTSSKSTGDGPILTYLNLSNNRLTYLDGLEDIQNLSLLQELDLSYNLISNIQNSLFRGMGNLQRLNLAGNKLLYVPKGFGFMVNLVELDISRNEIAQLGQELGQLSKLESLNASYNQLSELPTSIAQLRSLKKLILTNNNLLYLDIAFDRLEELTWLDVSWNKLAEFPRNLNPSLKKLYIGHNHVEELPEDEIERLKNLRELSLRNNKLEYLPKELAKLKGILVVLDLENNKFKEKEYEETDVDIFLSWLADPAANPITFKKKEEAPKRSTTTQEEWHVESYKPSLYRLKGQNRVIVHKREVSLESLNEGDTFVLDVGKRLYLWNGKKSNKREREKGRLFADYIAQEELGGVPVIIVKDNSAAAAEFWRTLGGDRRDIQTAEQGGSDLQFEEHFFDYVTLFKFSNVLGRMGVDEISGHESPFFKDMLNSDHSYVLNCDSTIFIWCGRNSIQKERNWALLKAEDLQEKFQPYFCEIQWVIDGAETLLFREQFIDWGLDAIDMDHAKAGMPDEEEKRQVLLREKEMERIQRERERQKAVDEQRERERIENEKKEQERREREQKRSEEERKSREEQQKQELANARRGKVLTEDNEEEDADADSDEDTRVISKMSRKELAEYRERRKQERERKKKERESKEKEDAIRREKEEKERAENTKREKEREKEEKEKKEREAQLKREREEKERKEREERQRKEREEQERRDKEKRDREAKQRKDREEQERKEKEKKEREEREKRDKEERERIQKEKREAERREQEKIENERKEKAERERREREEREKKEKADREKKEREDRERRERQERDRREKDRLEREEKERKERETKEEEERRKEDERRELDRLARKTKLVEQEEKERKEREAKEKREREEREKERKAKEEKEKREKEEQERKEREERAKKAREDLEKKVRDEKERKEREEREKKEREEKVKREREERERKAKEDREKREREEKDKREREERERKERDEKERKEREERKAREDREKKEREEKIKKEKEDRERKEREEREKREREEKAKKEKEERERKEREEKERKEREEREKREREEKDKEKREQDQTEKPTSLASRMANYQKVASGQAAPAEPAAAKPNFTIPGKTTTMHKISTSAPVVAELEKSEEKETSAAESTLHQPPASAGGPASARFGASKADICDTCSKRVYFSEKLIADGKTFHKTCFRCAHCNNTLKLGNYAALDGKLYCKPHFKQLFALKGNYAGGFGGKKPDELWAEKKTGGSAIVSKVEPPSAASAASSTPAPAAVGGSAIVNRPSAAKTFSGPTAVRPTGGSTIVATTAKNFGGGPAGSGGVSVSKMLTGTDAILFWAQQRVQGYEGVEVTNFTTSWKDGLAFFALAHSYRPDLVDWSTASKLSPGDRLEKAFAAFEAEGAIRLLDPEDITNLSVPDRLSMITYLGEVYKKTNKK